MPTLNMSKTLITGDTPHIYSQSAGAVYGAHSNGHAPEKSSFSHEINLSKQIEKIIAQPGRSLTGWKGKKK
ncbi:hypothetical protein ACJ4_07870 [Pantoea sp. QMID4]|nr:hypothetical protein ACJ3_07870 [Pantoea sp. QMID3]GME31476.1 hypothetical protein ACJ1_07820 [Pantoea sp. QMID1]GME51548.1 hypothetical protein ACJ4_07870 [Pantoea sp. QMID4]